LFTDPSSVAVCAHGRGETAATPSSLPELRIETCEVSSPRREEAEEYVRARFQHTHGATIRTFMPTLVLLTGADGALAGVAGCRMAGKEPLFLERYLECPIEELIARRTGARVKRSEIVESGNFACQDSATARVFMSQLPRYLIEREQTWIAFTATVSIRRILRSLGARCTELGKADGACVRSDDDKWGSYYANDPRVMVGYLPLARRIPALWGMWRAD
jgi:hypothetical protein